MDDFWDIAIPAVFLVGSMVLAGVLLSRVRSHAKPDTPEPAPQQLPTTASRRQRRILEKLEPIPELPTLMDLVRQEIADLGIEDIPGHEDVSGPVLLKVFKHDHPTIQGCDHAELEYVIAPGVEPGDAAEEDVTLVCPQCPMPGTDPDD